MSREFLAGLGFALLITACAGLGFNFKYYGMELASYESGKLLGPEPAADLPISVCAPDAQVKGKCVVMLTDAFYSLKRDYLETQQRLKECQGGLASH